MTSSVVTQVRNSVVLANRGWKVKLCRLVTDDSGAPVVPYRLLKDEDSGAPITEERWFKFTNFDLAVIDQSPPMGWGGVDAWSDALDKSPFLTLASTIAIVYELFVVDDKSGETVPDWKRASRMMVDGGVAHYVSVVMGALQMAQGVDPEVCGELVESGLEEVRQTLEEEVRKMRDLIKKSFRSDGDGSDTPTSQTTGSPGNTGSPDGQPSTVTSTSSGD